MSQEPAAPATRPRPEPTASEAGAGGVSPPFSNRADPVAPAREGEFLTAKEAAGLLGVKLPTLYAYTSRGLIQSVPGARGRARRYRRSDLERLCARRDARAGHGPVAAAALRQGEPVLDSAITLISLEKGPIYRGRSAVELARAGRDFESVAEGLWSGEWSRDVDPATWRPDDPGLDLHALERLLPERVGSLAVLSVGVSLLAARDPGRFSWHREAVHPRARRLLRRCAALLALGRGADDCLARVEASLAAPQLSAAIAAAYARPLGAAELQALDQALVLTADHELNASTFAARVAASTGADVYGCILAALAALSGPRHGGAADRVDALLEEAGDAGRVEQVVHDRQRRGEAIEGFAHPIYAPRPDPRGVELVAIARSLGGARPGVESALALVDAMEQGGFGGPSIDVGLVALARALGLPFGSAAALFAIGRSAGWVAHAIEQSEAGYLVRPRARYRES